MANWTNFLAKFSGSYLTIAEQLRDDSAITDVDYFYQLRNLVQSGLAEKLAALTSTGTGFLHEWATFLDTQKATVSSGTQSDESLYSDTKWIEFQGKFSGEYIDVIAGLRSDLKYTFLADWTAYINAFAVDYQALITAFKTDSSLTYSEYTDFISANMESIHVALKALTESSSFVDAFATLLNTKKAGLDTESTWTDFKNNFDADWQDVIVKLELDMMAMSWSTFYSKSVSDHKTDLENMGDQVFLQFAQVLINYRDSDWEKFLALSLTDLRDKLADLDSDSSFFSAYNTLLGAEMDDIVNFYDKLLDEFEDDEKPVVADFLEYIQTTADSTGIPDFEDFSAKTKEGISGYVRDFMQTSEGADYVTHFATLIKTNATNTWSGCVNSDDQETTFYNSFDSNMMDGTESFVTTMIDNTTISAAQDLASALVSDIEDDMKDLPCTHPFVQGMAVNTANLTSFIIPNYTYVYAQHGKIIDNAISPDPIAGLVVELVDTTTDDVLATEISDDEGHFFLQYTVIHESQNLPVSKTFDITIRDREDNLIHTESDVVAVLGSDQATVINIDRPAITEPTSGEIEAIFDNHPSQTLPTDLGTFLDSNSINNLFKIRNIGGLQNHDFESEVDDEDVDVIAAIVLIDQHASLDAANPDDIIVNQQLIDDGYTNFYLIADTALVDFKSDTTAYLTDDEAQEIHTNARAQKSYSQSIIASLLLGDRYEPGSSDGSFSNIWDEDWDDVKRKLGLNYEAKNTVDENASAVSPLAYLFDLIKFITKSVKDGETFIDINYLETNLYQRFSDLTGSPSSVSTSLNRTRAIVEILRRYLVANSISTSDEDIRFYLERAYLIALGQLGIDYTRLSKVLKGKSVTIDQLAEETTLDSMMLVALHHDLSADATTLSEEWLAEYFGIKDTNQSPLSVGTKITSTDPSEAIVEWAFDQVEHFLNTDIDGFVYLKLSRTGTTPNFTYTAEAYKDSALLNKVAEGVATTNSTWPSLTSGIIYLKQSAYSQLNGKIKFYYPGSDVADVKISLIPRVTANKLSLLRSHWTDLDAGKLLIDPDLINPGDLINPYALTDSPMSLWVSRKETIYDWLNAETTGLIDIRDNGAASVNINATSFESIADINGSVFTIDAASGIKVVLSSTGTSSAYASVTGSVGRIRSDKNTYLYFANDNTIHRYTFDDSDTPAASALFIYVDKDSTDYVFRDMFPKSNGNLLIGGVDGSSPNTDVIIELFPVKPSNYIGNQIIKDSSGNVYVLNSAKPNICQINNSGETIAHYGYWLDEPERHYLLNDTDPNTLFDSANMVDAGTWSGVSTTDGKVDDAISLNSGAGFIQPDDLSGPITNLSIAFWCKVKNPTLVTPQILLNLSDSDDNQGINVYLLEGTLYINHWRYDDVEEIYLLQPTAQAAELDIQSDIWYHIAVTYDAQNDSTIKTNGLKLYVNGQLQCSISSIKLSEDQNIFIGGLAEGKAPLSHVFNRSTQTYETFSDQNGCIGVFDELYIYLRSLNPNDIMGLYDDTTDGALVKPYAISLNNLGEVCVVDSTGGKVIVFNNDGSYLRSFDLQNVTSGDIFPSISIDNQGYVYIADLDDGTGQGQVQIYDNDGAYVSSIDAYSSTAFKEIHSVHIDAQGRLFVGQIDPAMGHADSVVHVFDITDGVAFERQQISEAQSGSAILTPESICTDALGNLYIADTANSRIIKYSRSLIYQAEFGGADNFMFEDAGAFTSITGLNVSSDGLLYFANGSVASDAAVLFTMQIPTKITRTGGNLYSIVSNEDDEVFFSTDTTVTRYSPRKSAFLDICGISQVSTPRQLDIDGFGRIYIADKDNDRILIIDRNGELIRSIDSSYTTLSDPTAVTVSPYLEIYMTGDQSGTDKCIKFDLHQGLAALMSNENFISISANEIANLERQENQGVDISSNLSAHHLSHSAFRKLSALLQSNNTLDESDWQDVYNISIQARKLASFDTWKGEETALGIVLTSDFFRLHSDRSYQESRIYISWRASYLDRLEWEQRLSNRVESSQAALSAGQRISANTDSQCISILKALLIQLTGVDGNTLDEKENVLSSKLFIDVQDNSGRATTRLAIAIETLQSLIWKLRTGQLENSLTDLHLITEDIEADWKWRSSYKTWKSAQFNFLFPENLLLPEIKPNQTAVFQDIVNTITTNPYITPQEACGLANQYAQYLGDISHFDQLIGCFSTKYEGKMDDPCGNSNPTGTYQTRNDDGSWSIENKGVPVIYFFGLIKSTGRVYYSVYYYELEKMDNGLPKPSNILSEWLLVPNIENAEDLAACVSYPKQPRTALALPVESTILYYTSKELNTSIPTYIAFDNKKSDWGRPKVISIPPDLSEKQIRFRVSDGLYSDTKLIVATAGNSREYYSNRINGLTQVLKNKEWKKNDAFPKTNVSKTQNVEDTQPNTAKFDQFQCAGEACVMQIWKGVYGFSYFDFMFSHEDSDKIFNIRVPYSNAKIDLFARYQDSDQQYIVIFSGDDGQRNLRKYFYIIHFEAEWAKNLFKANIVKEGRWTSDTYQNNGIYMSAIFSPESYAKSLFNSNHSGYTYFSYIISLFPNGSYVLHKSKAILDGYGNITNLIRSVPSRYLTPANSQIPYFSSSLRPVGEPSASRKFLLRYVNILLHRNLSNHLLNTFEEAYLYLPLLIADRLQRNGYFDEALDWYRLVYDNKNDVADSKIFPLLVNEESNSNGFIFDYTYISDPDNPHNIARTRSNAYSRYVIASMARCFIEYGDDEFTKDTSESLAKAWSLYQTALDLITEAGYNYNFTQGEIAIKSMDILKTEDDGFQIWLSYWNVVMERLSTIKSYNSLLDVITIIETKLGTSGTVDTTSESSISEGLAVIEDAIDEAIRTEGKSVAYSLDTKVKIVPLGVGVLKYSKVKVSFEYKIELDYTLDIPRNLVSDYLSMYAQINLFKLRNNMNISGMERSLDIYATSADSKTGLSFIGIGGQIVTVGATYGASKSQYHYRVLLERAKQLVQTASQMEYSMLNALEKFDIETYSLKKADQDISLAQENVNLQSLRVDQSELSVQLAENQIAKINSSISVLKDLIDLNYTTFYKTLLDHYEDLKKAQNWLTSTQTAIQAINYTMRGIENNDIFDPTKANPLRTSAYIAAYSGATLALTSLEATGRRINSIYYDIQRNSLESSLNLRKKDWEYQKNLADSDLTIAQTQKEISKKQTQISAQEKRIADLQQRFTEASADFLANKFTNADLYRWMSQVLEGVYSYFLRQATNMTRQAVAQLAFETQENVPVTLSNDYWQISNSAIQSGKNQAPERKGLTGSARLLQDITKVEEYAFASDSRRLELTRVISLASLYPHEFQSFKETGVLRFSLSNSLFDRDFPGHYLRLIKQIKTHIIALVPPLDGIKATLSNNGISRAVVGGKGVPFSEVAITKQPESVALTGNNAANGLFELVSVYNQEKLLPFEGLGISTQWEFRMPKASNFFDFSSIADVLFTIDYTAREDRNYRQQVINELGTDITTNRSFSFRYSLPDQWYDLLHPEETRVPMSVSFILTEKDFPANISNLAIEDIVLYLANGNEPVSKFKLKTKLKLDTSLALIEGSAITNDVNLINISDFGSSFDDFKGKSPIGTWTIEFPVGAYAGDAIADAAKASNLQAASILLSNGSIDDIIFIINYRGSTPAWPQ